MARGWESKDVESQREAREPKAPAAPARSDLQSRRDALLLQRTRVLHEMQTACNARFRGQLEASLKYLDAELARLEDNPGV